MSLNERSALIRNRSSFQNDDSDMLMLTAPVEDNETVHGSVERCTRRGFSPTFHESNTPPAIRYCISGLYAGARSGVMRKLPLSGADRCAAAGPLRSASSIQGSAVVVRRTRKILAASAGYRP